MSQKPLNFEQIESLRRHMLMTVGHLANFFGVSRETWYSWSAGKSYPRDKKEAFVRLRVKELLFLLTQHNWPTPDVIASSPKERYAKLLQALQQ